LERKQDYDMQSFDVLYLGTRIGKAGSAASTYRKP